MYINENPTLSASSVAVKTYETSDIKSVYQNTSAFSGYVMDFSGDTVLQASVPEGFNTGDEIFITTAGAVTCPGRSFLGIRSDSIIAYLSIISLYSA